MNSKEKRVEVRHISLTSFTIVIAIFLLSCAHKESKIKPKTDKWMCMSWFTGNQQITIFNYTDSIQLETRNYKYTPSKESYLFKNATLVSTDTAYAKLSKSELDSIKKWTRKLITEPVSPKVFVTEYVGSLFVKVFITDQVSQSCRYTSIGDWDKLSRETVEMKKLLCKKFKTVK